MEVKKQSTKPIISVIIPVYNGSLYVDRIMDEINKQSYQDLEVIFINDGSKDDTLSKLEKIKKHNRNIRLFTQENAGVSSARNKGIEISSGKYLSFVDVDDLLHTNYFEILIKSFDETTDVVFSKYSLKIDQSSPKNINKKVYENTDDLLLDFLYHKVQTGIWGMLINKKIVSSNRLYFDENYAYSEDLHMVWRVFSKAKKVVYLDLAIYGYNENVGSAMTKMSDKRLQSMELISSLDGFIKANRPNVYPEFKKYAEARIAWSVLWQAAHYFDYKEFKGFTKKYNFNEKLKMLITYPNIIVICSSVVYLVARALYFVIIKSMTSGYRK